MFSGLVVCFSGQGAEAGEVGNTQKRRVTFIMLVTDV